MMKWAFLLFFALLFVPSLGHAYNVFHPEADTELKETHIWTKINCKKSGETFATIRAWYPFPPEKVFQVITDTNHFSKIHKSYLDSYTLTETVFEEIVAANPQSADEVLKLIKDKKMDSFAHRNQNQNWKTYIYVNFDFPWPITNRWALQKISVDESNAPKGEYKYSYKMKVGNFKYLKGYWELLPIPDKPGWTEFRGQYESDANMALPPFVVKKALRLSLKKDFEENKKAIQKSK